MSCHGSHEPARETSPASVNLAAEPAEQAPVSNPLAALIAWLQSPRGVAVCLALALAGIYLAAYHGRHVTAALPFLLLLACPLMHVLMMFGMGHGQHSRRNG